MSKVHKKSSGCIWMDMDELYQNIVSPALKVFFFFFFFLFYFHFNPLDVNSFKCKNGKMATMIIIAFSVVAAHTLLVFQLTSNEYFNLSQN